MPGRAPQAEILAASSAISSKTPGVPPVHGAAGRIASGAPAGIDHAERLYRVAVGQLHYRLGVAQHFSRAEAHSVGVIPVVAADDRPGGHASVVAHRLAELAEGLEGRGFPACTHGEDGASR